MKMSKLQRRLIALWKRQVSHNLKVEKAWAQHHKENPWTTGGESSPYGMWRIGPK